MIRGEEALLFGLEQPEELRARVCNIVATCSIGIKLDLNVFCRRMHFMGAKLNESRFVAVTIKFTDSSAAPRRRQKPEITILQFASGYVVCTGGKDMQNVEKTLITYAGLIRTEGNYPLAQLRDLTIENIVAKCDYPFCINLKTLASTYPGQISYDESFPGARIRFFDDAPRGKLPPTADREEEEEEEEAEATPYRDQRVTLVFSTGRLVVPGTNSLENIAKRIERVVPLIRKHAVFKTNQNTLVQGVECDLPAHIETEVSYNDRTLDNISQREAARRCTGLSGVQLVDKRTMIALMKKQTIA